MSNGQWTHCIDIMKECFLRIISWIENILFLVVFSQASLWWRLKPHVASQFQAKQRLRPRDGGRCGLVSFSYPSFILRPGSKLRRASTKGLPFGARKKPPLVMRYKVGAHFLPQFAISARSNICQRETHSCLFSQGFFSSPEENQPTCHYNANHQSAPTCRLEISNVIIHPGNVAFWRSVFATDSDILHQRARVWFRYLVIQLPAIINQEGRKRKL